MPLVLLRTAAEEHKGLVAWIYMEDLGQRCEVDSPNTRVYGGVG